ncbi:MAG: Hsp20/alpha crystallin family protein [Saprospiraceae bacterium]|nr:Hsp20/alpha crystallin family protein [Saprospiraceae bacterium]
MNLVLARPTVRTQSKARVNSQAPVRTNIVEFPEKFEVRLALPGYKKEEISVNLNDHTLWVEGTINTEENDQMQSQLRLQEFLVKNFKKSYFLGEDIDESSIDAHLSDGVLTITLVKKEKVKKAIDVS